MRISRSRLIATAALICGLAGARPALAAVSEICGDGIDDSLATGGSAAGTKGSCPANYHDAIIGNGCDADCDTPDKDHDGYTSDGTTGFAGTTYTDCDDTDARVRPNEYVPNSWSSPTGYKLCQTNGTYGSTILNATTPLCESSLGTSGCFYIDFTSGNDANSGTYASPWKTLGKVSGGSGATGLPASPHTIISDEYVYILGTGTTSTTITYSGGSTSELFESTSDGTSGHGWVLKQYPGATASFSNSNGFGLVLEGATYATIDGLTGSTARTAASNISSVYIHNSSNIEVKNVYISSMSGHGDNNDACVYLNGTHDTNVHHNYLRDCKKSTGNQQNIWAITHLDETGGSNGANHIDDFNTIWWQTFDSTNNGGGIRTKHGVTNTETGANGHRVRHNTVLNAAVAGIRWTSSGLRANGNRLSLDASVYGLWVASGDGGTAQNENNKFQYNTMISGLGLEWNYPYYTGTELLTMDHNIVIATPASYVAGNNDGVISIDGYGSDAQKTTFDGGMLSSDRNCFYSPNATAVFSYFATTSGGGGHGPAGNAGANYAFSGAPSWLNTVGQDANSLLTDPGTSSPKYTATSSCSTYGWNNAITTTSTTSTTTTAASTTTVPYSVPFFKWRGRKH